MAGGLGTGEVAAFQDASLNHLRPLFGVCEFGKSSGLGGSALAAHSYPVDEFTIWTWTLIDRCHCGASSEVGDTAKGPVDREWTKGAGEPLSDSKTLDSPYCAGCLWSPCRRVHTLLNRMYGATPITGSGSIGAGNSDRARARPLLYAGTQRPQLQNAADA
jgi:hypothetical protein